MKFRFTCEQLDRMEKSQWLTRRERIIFKLYFRDEIHIEDVAAELDVSRRTIDRDLLSIRKKTKQNWIDVG